MIAIICAAGSGKRLRPLTIDRPKPLIKVGTKTILEHMVDNIVDLGINKIKVVVGYQKEKVIKTLGQKERQCGIDYIYNSVYETTNNIYSLCLAMQETNEDIIFFNGDIIFNRIVLKDIIQSNYDNSIVISNSHPKTTDSMKVTIKDNRLLDIGKNIMGKISGEAFGIYRLSSESVKTYLKIANKLFLKDLKNKNISFVVPLKEMFLSTNFRPVYCDEKYFVEIDTLDDYKNAQIQINKIIG